MFRFKKLIISVAAAFVIFLSLSAFMRRQYVLPILMYHSISPNAMPQNRLAVSVDAFERQMRFLKEHRYNVLTLEEIKDLMSQGRRPPPKAVAITFDDGYKNNYTYAFPILKKYNLTATIFIIINEIGRLEGDRLSWDEIKIMRDSGLIDFGSHTLGPQPLVDIRSQDDLRKQIFDSKKILEEKLGRKINIFSYPGGFFNGNIRRLVIDAGYQAAVATSPGRRFSSKDIFALKRLRISSSSDNLFVFWIEASGIYTFIKEHRDDD
jgi:peptidoglycan/xylan/chitin deacetylase (PgdA/CDA1 family)